MSTTMRIWILSVSGFISASSYGGIPEPDAILYGTLQIGTRVIRASDDVLVIARVNGVASPVGQYHMGDRPDAGDKYVLQIHLESLVDGSPRSDGVALVGETASIRIKEADGPEQIVGTVPISERGLVQALDIFSSCTSALTSSTPPNCAIDARRPNNGPTPVGWNSVGLSFNCLSANPVPSDFSVSVVPSGVVPSISNVVRSENTVTLTLNAPISAGVWTCFTHVPSGTKKCLGSLPGDVNGNRTTAPADILEIIDNLNGVRIPPLAIHQCDLDRSGLCAPADIITHIDMLNGAKGFIVWNGKTLPACPSNP